MQQQKLHPLYPIRLWFLCVVITPIIACCFPGYVQVVGNDETAIHLALVSVIFGLFLSMPTFPILFLIRYWLRQKSIPVWVSKLVTISSALGLTILPFTLIEDSEMNIIQAVYGSAIVVFGVLLKAGQTIPLSSAEAVPFSAVNK